MNKDITIDAENGRFVGRFEEVKLDEHITNEYRECMEVKVELRGDLVRVGND